MNRELIKTTINDKTVDELRGELDELVTTLENVTNNKTATQAARDAAQQSVNETLKALNTAFMEKDFIEWANDEKPMLAALTDGYYTNVRIVRKVDKDTAKVTLTVEPFEKTVDLCKFDDMYAGSGNLCVNGQWRYKAERFSKNLAKRIADELKAKAPGDDFRMSDKAGKEKLTTTGFSNTDLLKQLNEIVSDIIFNDNGSGENEYKALSHDVKFLLYSIPKRYRNVRLSITVASVAVVRELIAEICHRIVTGKTYSVDYKRMTAKTAKPKAKVPTLDETKAKFNALDSEIVEAAYNAHMAKFEKKEGEIAA